MFICKCECLRSARFTSFSLNDLHCCVVLELRTEGDQVGRMSWSDSALDTTFLLGGNGLIFDGSSAFQMECNIWAYLGC